MTVPRGGVYGLRTSNDRTCIQIIQDNGIQTEVGIKKKYVPNQELNANIISMDMMVNIQPAHTCVQSWSRASETWLVHADSKDECMLSLSLTLFTGVMKSCLLVYQLEWTEATAVSGSCAPATTY